MIERPKVGGLYMFEGTPVKVTETVRMMGSLRVRIEDVKTGENRIFNWHQFCKDATEHC